MQLGEAILESWDRQVQIVNNIAALVTEENKNAVSAEGEWPLWQQLAHIHIVRWDWAGQIDKAAVEGMPTLFWQEGEDWKLEPDLAKIKPALAESARAVRQIVETRPSDTDKAGPYDHSILFLQHMIWHEGWHVGAIIRTFRAIGQELPDEWEEKNIWGLWRKEETQDS